MIVCLSVALVLSLSSFLSLSPLRPDAEMIDWQVTWVIVQLGRFWEERLPTPQACEICSGRIKFANLRRDPVVV